LSLFRALISGYDGVKARLLLEEGTTTDGKFKRTRTTAKYEKRVA
jgi:hypothetical protein